jgi:ABC-2 type transport system ATP-binding protein
MSAIIRVEHLTKRFDATIALRDVSLSLSAGVHLLRGANGSGKSTLLRVLAGAEPYDYGSVAINGIDLGNDPQGAKAQLGWLPGDPDVYGFLRGEGLLRMVAAARHATGAEHEVHIRGLLEKLAIDQLITRRFDAMSLGMQRKFMIVAAFVGKPPCLLLDEPANALDADALVALNALVIEHARHGAVLIASHDHTFEGPVTSTIALQGGAIV